MTGRLSRNLITIILVFCAFFAGGAGKTKIIFPSPGEKFYYFNPDSPQSNMARLKLEMDTFLQQAGFAVSFTPFAKFNDFDRLTTDVPPNFVLLPKWYLDQNHDKIPFTPLLVPTRNGPASYRKLLLTSKHSGLTLENLSKRTLAMTFMGREGGNVLLNKLLFSQLGMDVVDLNVIITPKDSDALFALALGQVDMAFVSKNNLTNIANVNPRIAEAVRTLTESMPISLPVLCVRKGALSQEKIAKIKTIFLASNKETNVIMEMLQFDGWQEYSN